MKKATINYLLNEEGRKANILAGGNGKRLQTMEVEATPDILELASVNESGEVKLNVGFRLNFNGEPCKIKMDYKIRKGYDDKPEIDAVMGIQEFDAPQNLQSLIAWEKNRVENLSNKKAELKPELERLLKEWEQKQKEIKEKEEEKQKKARAQEEKLEKQKSEWIEQYGSDYLKEAYRLGYDCHSRYVEERAKKEFPEFIVDIDDEYGWEEIKCPSEEALKEVKELLRMGYKAEIVKLLYDGYDDDINQEAIVIRRYLGKYDLVKY